MKTGRSVEGRGVEGRGVEGRGTFDPSGSHNEPACIEGVSFHQVLTWSSELMHTNIAQYSASPCARPDQIRTIADGHPGKDKTKETSGSTRKN